MRAEAAPATETATMSGVIRNADGKGLADALVIIQCTCLQAPLETRTNANGLYAFRGLPPGTYMVQFFAGEDQLSREIEVQRGKAVKVFGTLNPVSKRDVLVKTPVGRDAVTGTKADQDTIINITTGDLAGDAVNQVIELDPYGGSAPGGKTIAGSTSSEVGYTLDGGSTNDPTTGRATIPAVQEFIDEVEVQASGYEAEYGGSVGGRAVARRISGSNKLRGRARFTYTPRLARPRFIVQTDNAVRTTEAPDYFMQGVLALSGPIIVDRLFWSGGIDVLGSRSTLNQGFYARDDLDNSGGYEDCPYENGTRDCVEGRNYIATTKFAEQNFPTRGVRLSGFFGLDWAINPRHRLAATARASPSFVRRSFRRPLNPAALDPDSLGANPYADPQGGLSLVSSGIVNDHFGWDRASGVQGVLDYKGRVAGDTLEIDGGVAYLRTASDTAWRLDNPSLKDVPTTTQRSNQGRDLFELLDEDDDGLLRVPAASKACNDADLPGLTCPVRSWISGGVGQYGKDRAHRAEGWLSLTHFFNALGSHQLKYGAQIEHEQRRRVLQYSGSNAADFYDNCEAGQRGGGEWCYDSDADDYILGTAGRVDNHRAVLVGPNSPNDRTTFGYGRVRKEQGDLRAIATPIGSGARVAQYDETVASQNYAVFMQDKWMLRSNLSITPGVRWEIQDMRDILGRRALFMWDNVAPRMNMVYDWTDEGRSRLYASYGWVYQKLPLALLNRVYGGQVQVTRTFDYDQCRGQTAEIQTSEGLRNPPKEVNGQPTEYCVDNGGFGTTTGLTEGGVVPRLRGQYEQQFQIGYEQEIIEDLTIGLSWLHKDLGRAVEDVSTNGGLDFIIANPGVGVDGDDIARKRAECDQLSSQLDSLPFDSDRRPQVAREVQRCEFLVDAYGKVGTMFSKPTRNYDAFSLVVTKWLADDWMFKGSYTYSRHVGNYDGYVDPLTGAVNLGASSQYDTPELVRNSYGPLSFNTPHVMKLDSFYTFDLGKGGSLTGSGSVRLNSGYPISLRGGHSRYGDLPTYVVPRGAGGRVAPNYQVNLGLTYAYPIAKTVELAVAARLFNVTNAKAVLRVDEVYTFENTRPIAGGDLGDLKHAKIQDPGSPNGFFQRRVVARQGNFGVEAAFQNPLAAQFDVQLMF